MRPDVIALANQVCAEARANLKSYCFDCNHPSTNLQPASPHEGSALVCESCLLARKERDAEADCEDYYGY